LKDLRSIAGNRGACNGILTFGEQGDLRVGYRGNPQGGESGDAHRAQQVILGEQRETGKWDGREKDQKHTTAWRRSTANR